MDPAPDLTLNAENALAAIGIKPVLEGKPRDRRPLDLVKDGRKLLDHFLARPGRDALADLPEFDYDEVRELLDGAGTEDHARALFDAVPHHELGQLVGNAATGIINTLQQGLPRASRQDVLGTVPIRPAAMAIARFARTWSVALAPLIVLRDLCQGSLTSDMVMALKAFWPAFYEQLQAEVMDAIAEMRTKRPTWDLEPRRDRLLRMLMGQPAVNAELASDFQAMWKQQQPAAPSPNTPTGKPDDGRTDPGDLSTPGQQ